MSSLCQIGVLLLYMSLWHDSIAEMTPENAAIIDVIMIDVIMIDVIMLAL